MRRISTPTAAQDLFGPGKHGFRNGDPANAILATRLQAEWFNALQEEVASLVEQAGIVLDPEDSTQLLKAVRKLRGGTVNFGFWQWSAVGANPEEGRVTLDNADPAMASSLLIAESSAESLDYSTSLGLLRAGDTVSIQERDAATVSHRYRVTGPAVDHGAYRSIPVSYVSGSGGAPAVDAMLSVLLTQAGASDAAVPLFAVQWWPSRASIPAGYAPADGQALSRATFPDAWAGIQAGNVPTVAEATWQATPAERGKYTSGDGASTFRLPDYNGKAAGSLGAVFLRGDGALSAAVSGAIQRDALQDFTGAVANVGAAYTVGPSGAGIAEIKNYTTGGFAGSGGSGGKFDIDLKVSNVARTASETRPLNVTGCWVVKLFGAVTNPGSADAAQLATDYAALAALIGAGPRLTKEYVSPSQTIVAGGLITLTHNLGAVPKSVSLEYVCTVATDGYSVGDVIDFSNVTYIHTSATTTGFNITKTATELLIRVGANGPAFVTNKTTGAAVALSNIAPNFKLVARAMA
ncbi:phage tail protein [Pseudomonas tohonis]|uniref:phage tail protein n=1 Tax=Pseudomonas tohonis TaxID=2725477 RepID=UPI001F4781EC|nr:phage tail protein [Pseudomonas tohonis]